MATHFYNCSLGFVSLKGLKDPSTQRVWHSACHKSQCGDRVKSTRRSCAINYKINDDVCSFHLVLYVRPKT